MAGDSGTLSGLKDAFDNLTEREQKLVGLLGVVLVLVVIVLPILLMNASLSEMESQNEELRAVMREIDQARPRLAAQAAERERNAALFENRAPALAGFVETAATSQGLSLREINDQPELALGNYMRRGLRVRLPDVALDPVLEMLRAIEDSGHPVSIGRLKIDRYRSSGNYNVEVGVRAYDPAEGGGDANMRGGSMRSSMGMR